MWIVSNPVVTRPSLKAYDGHLERFACPGETSMKASALATSLVTEVEHSGLNSQLRDRIVANRAALMRSADLPTALVRALVDYSGDEWPPAAHVLELLIDDARMDAENEGAFGTGFLDMLESAICSIIDEGKLTSAAALSLMRCYAHANVDVPAQLVSFRLAEIDSGIDRKAPLAPDLDEVIAGLIKEAKGDLYAVYEGVREIMAGLPVESRAGLVYELSSRGQAFSWVAATYALLDQAAPIREAAALALLHRTRQGRCDDNILRRLPMQRSWMPADAARAIVDDVIREARRRGIGASVSPAAVNVQRVLATLPDGADGQSFALVTRRKVGLILTKSGHGVKDAYVVDCRSDRQLRELLGQLRDIDALDVSPEIVIQGLAAALADGLAHGRAPAHGLVDVAEQFGMEGVRPQPMSPADWLRTLDPEGEVTALSAQKRRGLLTRSRQWCEEYPITDSWFEDNPEIRELLESTDASRRQASVVWSYLETRREQWASRILQSGLVVKSADRDWMSHVATGAALLEGHPLAKIPAMRQVVDNTLDAFDHHHGGQTSVEVSFGAPASAEDTSDLLSAVGASETAPSWLDGYLTAVVIAPKMPAGNVWMGGLLNGMSKPVNQETVEALIYAVMGRYNAIGSGLFEHAEAPGFSTLTDESLRAWARGFEHGVATIGDAWNARSLKRDDKHLVQLIGRIAAEGQLAFDPRAIITSWIASRFDKKR
jgi:hypothetical protein